MNKTIQIVLLTSLLNFSPIKPMSRIKLFLGTTALAAVTAIGYHIWTHYKVTRTLTNLINRRCSTLSTQVDSVGEDVKEIKEQSIPELKSMIQQLQNADLSNKQTLILLLRIALIKLTPAEKNELARSIADLNLSAEIKALIVPN